MVTETTQATPQAPGAVPLFGHALSLLSDPLRFLTSLPACDDLARIRVGSVTALVICDPELTRQVLLDDRTFDKGGPLFDRYREALGDEIVTCPHSEHRQRRRLLQPAFRTGRLPGYARVMSQRITEVTDSWHDGRVIDVLADMQAITARTAVVTLFSDALGGPAIASLVKDFAAVQGGLFRRMLLPPPLDKVLIWESRRYARALAGIRRTAGLAIAGCRSSGADNGDVLSTLVASRDDDGRRLSDDEIGSQIMSFFLASTETTACTVAWALHLLAGHPDIEEQLHAEVDAVVGGSAVLDDVPKLPLTGRIITETLRLYPPGWILTRVATRDTTLGGHHIPAGANIIYSPYLIHHLPGVFTDPERFNPGRWDGESSTPPRGAIIPFGGGPRKCMGDTFAVTEATLTLATIAARWHLEHVPGTRVRPARGLVLHPRGLRMRATSRGDRHLARERGERRAGTASHPPAV
jgi:pentalenene oxygenase